MLDLLAWLPCTSVWIMAVSTTLSQALRTRVLGAGTTCGACPRASERGTPRVTLGSRGCLGLCRLSHRPFSADDRLRRPTEPLEATVRFLNRRPT